MANRVSLQRNLPSYGRGGMSEVTETQRSEDREGLIDSERDRERSHIEKTW